jgi:hypothetical protein
MSATVPHQSREKLALIWAARKEKLVAIRVYYEVFCERGCTVYSLQRMEEAGQD